MSLSTFISNASRSQAVAGLQFIKANHLPNQRFVDATNRLASDGVRCVDEHFRPVPPAVFSTDDAKTYLGSAAYLHSFDGWQYLSQAIDALFTGDYRVAVHLSYYAELRAAMGFLASEGIAVFSSVHFCKDGAGLVIKDPFSSYNAGFWRGHGTHKFVWECLKEWIHQPAKSTDNILKGFFHNGISFKEWIPKIPHANSVGVLSPLIKTWLSKWTFDIQNFVSDRDGRNNSSYRPSILPTYLNQDLKNLIDSYKSFVSALEPSGSNRFSLLDKHLFALLFREVHAIIVQNGIAVSIEDLLTQTFQNAGKPLDLALKTIIVGGHQHGLITAAQDTLFDATGNVQPLTIFARALLLLRLCTGNISVLFNDASITHNELSFFHSFYGTENGFWKQGDAVPDFEDLWTDVGDAVLEIGSWADGQALPISLRDFNNAKSLALCNLKQINRSALWGVAI